MLAVVFLFSGFVKAADPAGMAIKLNAYLRYWGVSLPDESLLDDLETAPEVDAI